MNWSISLALLCSVVFSTKTISCTEQVTTPWENAQIADNFIASFLRVISRSSAFSTSQLQDMATIRKTLTEAMEIFNNSNMSSKTKMQTLNMVFASALAEIIAIEYGGVSIETKTNEIENALSLSFQETMGLNNPQFVGDIKTLIFTLARTKATSSSTESVVKVGDYKQGQLGTSVSAKAMSASSSALQGSSGLEPQRPSTVGPPIVSVSTGGYRPPMVSVTKPLGQLVQTPTEQYAKVSKQTPLNMKNSLDNSEFGPQKSSPQVTSFLGQQGLDGYGTGVPKADATGGELRPSVKSSGVNELWQQSSMGKIAQVSSSQGNSAAVVQGPSANVLATPISYGEGTAPMRLQATPEIGGNGISTQEASKVSRQGPVVYEARAQSSSEVKELEAGGGVINPLREGSSAYLEQEQETKGASVAVDTRSEVKDSGNYRWGTSASMSERVVGFKQPAIRVGPQQNPVTIEQGAESWSSSASRAAATAETGSYLPSTGAGRVQHEEEGFQRSSRAGNQYDRGIRGQTSSGQIQDNQGLYGTRYQAIAQSGGQDLRSYKLEADAKTAAVVGVSEGQVSSRQGLSEVEEQELDSPRVSAIESRPSSYGLNNYGQGSAAAVEADATDYKSINNVREQQGIRINNPALVGGNSYASGSAAAIAGSVRGNGPFFTPEGISRVSSTSSAAAVEADATEYKSISNVRGQQGISINNPALAGGNNYASGSAAAIAESVRGNGPVFIPEGSSRVSSTASSLGSNNLQENSALSNAVSSIVSKVGTANPGMSDCNVLIQTMLEIIADLVHLLGYCT